MTYSMEVLRTMLGGSASMAISASANKGVANQPTAAYVATAPAQLTRENVAEYVSSDREVLLGYLRCVLDCENTIFQCSASKQSVEETLSSLEQQSKSQFTRERSFTGQTLSEMGVAGLIVAPMTGILDIFASRGRKKGNEKAQKEDEERIKVVLEKTNVLNAEIPNIDKTIAETSTTLQKLYDLDIIAPYPKYRNIHAVSMFYEYIDAGRCTTLRTINGVQGAYELYQREIDVGRVLDRLDLIREKLDVVQHTMSLMYNAIQESNRLSTAMLTELDSVRKSATATAFYTRAAANNSRILVDLQRNSRRWNELVDKSGRYVSDKNTY